MQAGMHHTVDHLFRHEAGKMIAVLSKMLGLQHLSIAEDLVQDTLLQALSTWPYSGIPDNPPGWLHRVARNKAIDYLRRQKTIQHHHPQYNYLFQSEYTLAPAVQQYFEEEQIQDSQLRMIFVCCHPSIPADSQIALALKTLCGLSAGEIARAFLKDEGTIAKRIYRAKEKIRTEGIELEMPPAQQVGIRLQSVWHCLYLLFNEGYNSSHPDWLIREDLCEEAIRLCYLLTQNKLTNKPTTNALLALFCFQASRLRARIDDKGNIVLMRYQDRSRWYRPLINKGIFFLEAATQKETSFYHLEAAIAYFHAIAPSFEQTDWKAIYYLYCVLYQYHPTPFIALNKAIAASFAIGTNDALQQLHSIKELEQYYLYHTALGEVYFDAGQLVQSLFYFNKALNLAPTVAEKQLLEEKIERCT
jgi:RNA polymerase sigma-70 factor (ECF subfamily)